MPGVIKPDALSRPRAAANHAIQDGGRLAAKGHAGMSQPPWHALGCGRTAAALHPSTRRAHLLAEVAAHQDEAHVHARPLHERLQHGGISEPDRVGTQPSRRGMLLAQRPTRT